VVDSFRIHPAIGIARVGNSEEYVISPETMAGSPVAPGSTLTGGLPIRPADGDPVRSSDLRDAGGALKRQAARFRVFAYPSGEGPEAYPRGDGTEIVIGSIVDGKTVDGILWTVHVANKKANQFVLSEGGAAGTPGIGGYENGELPPIRNAGFPAGAAQPPVDQRIATLASPARTAALIVDPGPRTIGGASAGPVKFDQATVASYSDGSPFVEKIPDYPKSFPAASFPERYEPSGPIDTLGELLTDEKGRLLVLGGYGRAVSWKVDGQAGGVDSDVNNDQWFDDGSDGPVSALIFFTDGSTAPVAGAWVTTTDPSFAPQIRNIVTLWEDIYDSWVRTPVLNLAPQIYDIQTAAFRPSYKPIFDQQVAPIFQSAALQQWAVNLSVFGMDSHMEVGSATSPSGAGAQIFLILRNPDDPSQQTSDYMPLHLGDAGHAFLSLRDTQYFFVQQWNAGNFVPSGGPSPGPGEYLDMAVLANCLGGRFSPGIDLTFVMREASIYDQSWQSSGSGPFRVNAKALAYGQVMPGLPLLGVGYVPRQNAVDLLEPGDLSKFMAIPWHTDYNSCATHPATQDSPSLFWSWPAQRPVAVYTAAEAMNQSGTLGPVPPAAMAQQWSVRGPGTESDRGENWGRYQDAIGMVTNWSMIGTILQAPQIDFPPSSTTAGAQPSIPDNWYLEAESQLPAEGQKVWPFPNYVGVPGH
jgi:hypothetical protein